MNTNRTLLFALPVLALSFGACIEGGVSADGMDAGMLKETASQDIRVYCGDDWAATGPFTTEICDGGDLRGETCESLGYDGGTLGCMDDCTGFDAAACDGDGVCGNGVLDDGESCDYGDDNGVRCDEYDAACTACSDTCEVVDGTVRTCGDDIRDRQYRDEGAYVEECDGADLGDVTCESLGYLDGGTLACNSDCGGFDVSGCLGPNCGNGLVDDGEECDEGGANTESCAYGEQGCTVCRPDCTEGPGDVAYCGDRVLNGMEECEIGDTQSCSSTAVATCTDQCKWNTDGCFGGEVGLDVGLEDVPHGDAWIEDTGDEDTGVGEDVAPVPAPRAQDESGCSATGNAPTAGWIGLALGLIAMRRRR